MKASGNEVLPQSNKVLPQSLALPGLCAYEIPLSVCTGSLRHAVNLALAMLQAKRSTELHLEQYQRWAGNTEPRAKSLGGLRAVLLSFAVGITPGAHTRQEQRAVTATASGVPASCVVSRDNQPSSPSTRRKGKSTQKIVAGGRHSALLFLNIV